MNKNTRRAKIIELAAKGLGRPAILKKVPGTTEWEVRTTLRSKTPSSKKSTPEVESPRPSTGMKILGIDIETTPNIAHVWGLFNQNIAPVQLVETGRTICFAYKWMNDPNSKVGFVSEFHQSKKEMFLLAHKLLDEADAVVHYNGINFDIPSLNKEFLKLGMLPPSPFKQIDLLQVVRKQFRFVSNKLAHILVELEIGAKISHSGHEMWANCMKGDKSAWEEMKGYNIGDVYELEKLYIRLLPWISNHPNHALYQDTSRPACTNCGGTHLQSRGKATTKSQEYRRFQCSDCGTWSRERYTSLPKEKRHHILTQSV